MSTSRSATRLARINASVAAEMASMTFGVELETEGRSRSVVANAIAAALNAERPVGTAAALVRYEGGYYDKYTVTLADGRKWTCMSDGSLMHGGCEVVSPVCRMADMDTVQTVVRAVRACGATVSQRCGMHVHVGFCGNGRSDDENAKAVARLAVAVRRNEDMMFRALVSEGRRHNHYCAPVDSAFVTALGDLRTVTMRSLCKAWYESHGDRYMSLEASRAHSNHYHGSRYHGLNLHSFFARGTVEFRYFDGTLHAGVVRAMITFCVAMSAYAAQAQTSGGREAGSSVKDNTRMARLLRRWGLKDETVLKHLTARIGGRPRRNAEAA